MISIANQIPKLSDITALSTKKLPLGMNTFYTQAW